MTETTFTDIIVVGAGIAGAGAAFALAAQGHAVTLVERNFPASGPTGQSSACSHVFYLMPELQRLSKRGLEILKSISSQTGESAGWNQIGHLYCCGNNSATAFRKATNEVNALGCEIEILTTSELSQLYPDFNFDGIEMGVWEPTGGYADSYSATNALVTAARNLGCNVRLNTEVASIVIQNGQVIGVQTKEGHTIHSDKVLLATGIWTRPLLQQVGVDLPIFIERHTMTVLDAPNYARRILPVCWADDILMNYGRPDGNSTILLGTWAGGGTGFRHERTNQERQVNNPDTHDAVANSEETLNILRSFLPRMPMLADCGIRPGYTGLYDMSPDDNPIIDSAPNINGLFIICGSSGHGFKMGAGVGEAAAAMAMGYKPDVLSPFTIDRFEE
tara:strand:+ start:1427 stop:2596 length:1170 start_codon:yes stop_codon:yes gene_type:complete